MTIEEFQEELVGIKDEGDLNEFSRRVFLHGTPFVFEGREHDYYLFKKRICKNYDVNHTEIFIVGSGKLGFSPTKRTQFSLDSDIDVAIVSSSLVERVSNLGTDLEYLIRSSGMHFRKDQWIGYHEYLRYTALGWFRPDLIPQKGPMATFKQQWFDFFHSISFDRSEVGNYKVTAGLFKSQVHLERYSADSVRRVRELLKVKEAEA
jgi:hypothetical protein